MIEKREIWFRAKRSPTKEWVEGYFYKKKFNRSDAALCSYITVPHPGLNRRPSDNILVIPETVGQYIGLNDMNGTKIFEGDIIKNRWTGDIHTVNWCVDCAVWVLPCVTDERRETTFNSYSSNEYVIIGNVFDNPELLKGGSEYVEENEDG